MTKESNEKVFAVDGDIIAYRTAAVCETHFEGAGYAILDSTFKEIVEETQISKMRIYLSGEKNFRYDIAKTKPYKGNRATMVRPQYLNAMKQHLIENYNAVVIDGFEADDAIATDMTVNGAFHCGIDKDILQIEGSHYNYVKKEWQHVTKEEAILTLYRQILMGDTSDNVPGLPRVGEKTAFNAIQNPETALDDCMAMYEEVVRLKMAGVNYIEYLAEQKALISMVKDVPLDYTKFYYRAPSAGGFEAQEGGFVGVDLGTNDTTERLVVKL